MEQIKNKDKEENLKRKKKAPFRCSFYCD